ncbi:MAG: 16S rRNA (cytosine(1402)-N(4))-methyltransferase RsmH [Bdellovibrionota bacterium]
MSEAKKHIPVMVEEVLQTLQPRPGQTILDMTVGAGGHFGLLADEIKGQANMVGIDRDPMCIEAAKKKFPESRFFHGSWTQALMDMDGLIKNIDGVLIDCGVSSMQLDQADRGFSFRFDAPLDMRMDTTQAQTARDLLYDLTEEEIANVLYEYADEYRSRRIAKSIVNASKQNKLNTTFDLVDAVTQAVGKRRGKTHPATKTFQAIRIKLNQEIQELENALAYLVKHLHKGARIVVITFHSLEDRVVKNIFRDYDRQKKVIRLNKKAIQATRDEYLQNPRARSAKVRGVEVIDAKMDKK